MVKVLSIADALCQIFETSFGDKAHILNMVKKVRKKKGNKAIKTEMDKAMKRMDEKMSEIKMFCIVITLFLNGLLAMAVLMMK